ncbi:MAG TPA: hypothetical protein VLX29_07870 [Nitrospirota bacterium]|nr:hypothetical protein [Nitrospirota bacterium]
MFKHEKMVIPMLLCALLFCACARPVPEGFRGMIWGSENSSFPDLVYDSTDPNHGGIKLYTKKDENLHIGNFIAEKILYGFWHDKLCSVEVAVAGNVNWEGLKLAAFEKFGSQSESHLDSFSWTTDATIITLKREVHDKGVLLLRSREIAKQQEEYDRRKAKEGL